MDKIGIVGSGITGIIVAKVLSKKGFIPTIIDYGLEIEDKKKELINKLSKISPRHWNKEDIINLNFKSIINNSSYPTKNNHGSNFFYGKSNSNYYVKDNNFPIPFSLAKGGFSNGWGASVLPPAESDISEWPLNISDLKNEFEEILETHPLSARKDMLESVFPIFKKDPKSISIDKNYFYIMERLKHNQNVLPDFLYGQSRLMVQPENENEKLGCQYCGQCMSGCVYNCIYKSNEDLDELIKTKKVIYKSGFIVEKIKQIKRKVTISYKDKNNQIIEEEFDRVFLAAGAVSSTKIFLQSNNFFNRNLKIKSTTSFILPIFSLRKMSFSWPNVNTQPGIFLEFKIEDSNKWIHTQLSINNELLLNQLKYFSKNNIIPKKIIRGIASRIIIANCNLPSELSDEYIVWLTKDNDENILNSKRKLNYDTPYVIRAANKKIKNIFSSTGFIPISFFTKNTTHSSGSYHVGSSMPMKKKIKNFYETNLLGSHFHSDRINIVDSSVLPSLPSTTIGLISMANAARIVNEIYK